MTIPSFVRQDAGPLYPTILYNRPVTRRAGGRLLVVGGHTGEFSLPTAIYQLAITAGVGDCRVVLPDRLVKLLGGAPATHFAVSSPSGSLGRGALSRILELSEEADAVMIGPSVSGNSDTAMLIERLAEEVARPLILCDEALPALSHHVTAVTDNDQALLIVTMAEVFKLCGWLGVPIHIKEGAGLINKLEIIADLAAVSRCSYAVYGTEIITCADNKFIVTPINYRLSLVPALFYAALGTFWVQNPTDRSAGLATGAYVIRAATSSLGSTNRPSLATIASALEAALKEADV